MDRQITLEQARMMNKLSRKAVSQALDVQETTIYNWEIGKTTPDAKQFFKLCALYGVPLDSIFLP